MRKRSKRPDKGKPKPAYRRPAPKPSGEVESCKLPVAGSEAEEEVLPHPQPIVTSTFILHEDGSITSKPLSPSDGERVAEGRERGSSGQPSTLNLQPATPPQLVFRDDARGVFLYHGNCLELLDAIAAKYPEGRFDMIFADPPYFLSNGGITCHAGKMVKVDKGDWDQSRGAELNHEFNLEWLKRCQRVLKPNGTIWVSGTHHVIFSIGYAMQQLGFKVLNDIAWEKPNPPPNLSCRYFTHSTETILWAAKNEKSKHTFNYAEMKAVTGKQMKTVWTMCAPGGAEKIFGRHATQKPIALLERCLVASTDEQDTIFDPFLGGGTTAVACVRLGRQCIGIERDYTHLTLACQRADHEVVRLWLRQIRVTVSVETFLTNDLDPDMRSMDRIRWMKDGEPKTDCIFHETKFVFLSCAAVSSASVVHTTVDVSLQEAWASAPNGKKRETTHIVRCQTEILHVKQ